MRKWYVIYIISMLSLEYITVSRPFLSLLHCVPSLNWHDVASVKNAWKAWILYFSFTKYDCTYKINTLINRLNQTESPSGVNEETFITNSHDFFKLGWKHRDKQTYRNSIRSFNFLGLSKYKILLSVIKKNTELQQQSDQ